jgi:ATP-binding cassette subfamily B protein
MVTSTDLLATSPDDFDFKKVVHIFVRTWPFIRPLTRHLLIFVALSGVVFLIGAGLGFIIIGLLNGGVIGGQPLGTFHATIFDLDPAVFVNVDTLSVEARRELPSLVVLTMIPFLAVAVVGGATLYYYTVWIFQRINQLMRVALIERLQAQSLAYHTSARTGDAIYRIYQDSAMVIEIIRSVFLEPAMFVCRYLVAVFVVALFNPWLAVALGVTVVPVVIIAAYFSPRLRTGFRRAREANSALTSWIQESFLGIRVIKATGSESLRQSAFDEYSKNAFHAAFAARVRLMIMGILVFVAVSLCVLFVQSFSALLSNAGAEVLSRDILLGFGFAVWNLGSYTAATGRAFDGTGSLNALLSLWGRAQDMAVGLDRVFEILDLESDIEDAPDATALVPFSREVRFDAVRFTYTGKVDVFSGIDFSANAGTVTALVGPTGTGKSTLMSLLLRLADPTSGRVLIDDVDVRRVTLDSLREQIAIATQENILFSDTVMENIRYAAPEATLEEVIAAAKVACADEFIDDLPQGYDTPLGERATKLSTGQRQRLVIARAIIKNAPILILDEPTAALDAQTESRVLANLKAWGAQRCVFLITHRLSTIRQADQVVYLRDGKVQALGRHDDLIAQRGTYHAFVEAESGALAAVSSAGDGS